MCCEFPATVYVCGGKGCALVKDFFGSIGMFCGALIRPFSGTSAKDVFTLSSGNPIAALQAIMVLLFYSGFAYALVQVIFMFTGIFALAPAQPQQQNMKIRGQSPDISMQQFMTTYAVVLSIMELIGMCIGSYCSWFGSVKRRGCIGSICCCVESYSILYLLSCSSCLAVFFSFFTMISYISMGSTASFILVLMMLPFCLLQIYSGVYLFKAAGLTDDEHDKDLESMSDSDSES